MNFLSKKLDMLNEINRQEEKIKNQENTLTQIISENAALKEDNIEAVKIIDKYQKEYENTGLECSFCHTTLQKKFVYCPNCGNETSIILSEMPSVSEEELFVCENDLGKALIIQYKGWKDKKITIPSKLGGKSVVGIWNGVFEKCMDLEEVIIEEGCQYIANDAFRECRNLKRIKFPKSLREIGRNAFENCTSLEEVILPVGVTNIGAGAFYECSNLKKVVLPEELRALDINVLAKTSIDTLHIPSSIRVIGSYALEGTYITELELPEKLYSIGMNAFNIKSLRKIIIHSGVKEIEGSIFSMYADVTIYCVSGSEAQLYARQHEINCVPIKEDNTGKIEPFYHSIKIDFGPNRNQLTGHQEVNVQRLIPDLGIQKAETFSWDISDYFCCIVQVWKYMDEAEKDRLARVFKAYCNRIHHDFKRDFCAIPENE